MNRYDFYKIVPNKSRKKNNLFFSVIKPNKRTRVIDIGAQVGTDTVYTKQLIDIYPWKENITAINQNPNHIGNIKKKYQEINAQVADALELPFADQYFDVAYSNAVIEHVGGAEAQKKFASEIMRVAKRYFIATPNRWYPFEFHLRLPLVTLFPGSIYLKAGSIVRYNHALKKYIWLTGRVTGLRLLSRKQLVEYFPSGKIIESQVTFMPESLIAVK